ncbi:MAG: hypothetical protein AMK70_15180 [Nitrospira bacterium SG8_35_1]|nr:MAG: hypothetical protein AMK70_15180 [Nitrospira bacterium SG8_35_1]
MIPKEILQQIRRIQITTSRMVTDVFAGHYHSVFKGRGMEFDEVREYQPGDDIRSIDWNVTARTGNPFVKKFVEERELTIMLVLDISRSSYFGSVNRLKREVAAEMCSLLAMSAIKNNDRVGLIAFTDRIEKFVPPRKGLSHVLRIIREAIYFEPVKRPLSIANRRHDIVALSITDPREQQLPAIGLIHLEDAEREHRFMLDTSSPQVRNEYSARAQKLFDERQRLFRSVNVDHIDIRTDVPYLQELYKFFRMRERRI